MTRKHWFALALCAAALPLLSVSGRGAEKGGAVGKISGRDLFTREWLPNDPRGHGGDGLGPVFNDSSCAACHNQGGIGGGGAASQNVDIATVFLDPRHVRSIAPQQSVGAQFVRALLGLKPKAVPRDAEKRRERLISSLENELKRIHPGFLNAQSLVVHKYSTHKEYEDWRTKLVAQNNMFFSGMGTSAMPVPAGGTDFVIESDTVDAVPVEALEGGEEAVEATAPEGGQTATLAETSEGFGEFAQGHADNERNVLLQRARSRQFNSGGFSQHGRFTIAVTQRNTTALFGAGRLDAISDKVLAEQAAKKHPGFPEITGRVCRLKGDKIGRFGWKAQTASLEDFALTACAVEVGLNVPGHTQAGLAFDSDYKAPALDMTKAETDALVQFLRDLPAPMQRTPQNRAAADYIHEGKALFTKVGCATCHTENLGEVAAVYSDLLLHDMGESLQDNGDYGVFVPDSPGGDQEPVIEQMVKSSQGSAKFAPKAKDEDILGAKKNEWRTPPLWGVADSAPYLHDGRANSLAEAIAFHDGEASRSSRMFFRLKPEDRLKVVLFLKTLSAPEQVAAR